MSTLEELLPEDVLIYRQVMNQSGKIETTKSIKRRDELTTDDIEDLIEMHEIDAAYNKSIAKDLRAIVGNRKIN